MAQQSSSVLLSACRTPFGKLGGALASLAAVDLGAHVIRAAIQRAGISGADVQHVIMGMVVQAGAGQIPSRQATFKAGLSREVTSDTINRVCASGMRAVTIADALIRAGEYDVIVAGGMESMSNTPYLLPQARFGYRMGNGVLLDAMQYDGLRCGVGDVVMGQYGDEVAAEENVSRKEQDAFALRSHRRAVAAIDKGLFDDEIVPIDITDRRGMITRIGRDEAPRPDTSAAALAKLSPVFHSSGTVTAGNAPGGNLWYYNPTTGTCSSLATSSFRVDMSIP